MVSKWSFQAAGTADVNAFNSFQLKRSPCITSEPTGENVIMLLCPWIAPIHHSRIHHRDCVLWIKHEAYLSWLRDYLEEKNEKKIVIYSSKISINWGNIIPYLAIRKSFEQLSINWKMKVQWFLVSTSFCLAFDSQIYEIIFFSWPFNHSTFSCQFFREVIFLK